MNPLRPSLAAALLAAVAHAQSQAPADVLAAFELRNATVQDLVLPQQPRTAFRLDLQLGGTRRSVVFEPHDMLAPDFKLLVDDGVTLREVAAPPPAIYRGAVLAAPESRATASLSARGLTASIHVAGATWSVQPLADAMPGAAPGSHVVYAHADMLGTDAHCGVDDDHQPHEPGNVSGPTGTNRVCEISIDADYEYYQRYGSSVVSTRDRVVAVMNNVDAIYQRDVGIEYLITAILVRTSANYTSTDPSARLSEFRAWWQANHTGIRRDTCHLFTGIGAFSGVVGVAYLTVICGSSGYGLSKAFSTTEGRNTGLVAHELGHNWSAGHCNSSTPCYIMCSSLSGCNMDLTRFAPVSITAITNHRNSRTCLGNPGTQPGSYTSFGTGCQGSNAQTPAIGSTLVPNVGRTCYINVTGAVANAPVILTFGVSNTTWVGGALPYHLGPIGALNCYVLCSVEGFLTGTTDANGHASIEYTVPANGSLAGRSFYNQFLVNDPAANALDWVVSPGAQATIGNW